MRMSDFSVQNDFVDQIYEAAFVPELWENVLHRMSDMSDGLGTCLFTLQADQFRWMCSDGMRDVMTEFITHWLPFNTRSERLMKRRYPGFLTDLDVYTEEELASEPLYTRFLRPSGVGWGAATIIQAPTGDTLVFNMERRLERGPVEKNFVDKLDLLRPHLARAALFSARLKLERAKAAADTLQLVGLAAAITGPGRRVMAANAMFEAAHSQVKIGAANRLSLANPATDAILLTTFQQLEAAVMPSVQSIPMAATEEMPAAILHLLPVRGSAYDIFGGGMTLLVITPATSKEIVPSEALETLFDLTPAEARVARGIGSGQTIDKLAEALGVSRETIRNQLKAVFSKTGMQRQADLTSLLSNISLPGRP